MQSTKHSPIEKSPALKGVLQMPSCSDDLDIEEQSPRSSALLDLVAFAAFTIPSILSMFLCLSKVAVAGSPYVSPSPTPLVSASDILPALLEFKKSTAAGLPQSYEVIHQRTFDRGNVLAAEEIILSPGSKLILAGPYGDRREKYIVARTIKILPGSPPPVITWERLDASSILPPPAGKAPPGSYGAQEGASGGSGTDGAIGNPGFAGIAAPTFYLAVNEIIGGVVYFDLRGQDGGPGGEGQAGGDGGNGTNGNPGSSSLFDCKRGGGNGGNGGPGGKGGPGGQGGKGGDGGSLILLAADSLIGRLALQVQADVAPGLGGPGGKGGRGGLGGAQGSAGTPAPPFCGGGYAGIPGNTGPTGPNALGSGPSGARGGVVSIPLSQAILSGIGLGNSP